MTGRTDVTRFGPLGAGTIHETPADTATEVRYAGKPAAVAHEAT